VKHITQQMTLDLGELVTVKYLKGATLSERFDQFDQSNPHVYKNLLRLTRKAVAAGMRRCSIATLYEQLRWHYGLHTGGRDYKLNNSFRAFYVRRLLAEDGVPPTFFETRRSAADREVPTC